MQHYYSLDAVYLQRSWITIGSYDGVHLGHHKILDHLADRAHNANTPAVAVTFFPHPAVILGKNANGGYLSTPDERAELMGALGIDVVVTMPFTRELAALGALEFMQLLKQHLNPEVLFVGYDFALGRQREGDIPRLQELGELLGYKVAIHVPVVNEGIPISSSQIRRLIRSGDVMAAARMLGRLYTISGKVIPGDGRGKSLGFPTANIEYWPERVMPPYGVYATWAWVDGVRYPSVTSLGVRPTFVSSSPTAHLEAHLIDEDLNLYGKELRLEFVAMLRPEERFASAANLIDQMGRDKQKAKEILEHEP